MRSVYAAATSSMGGLALLISTGACAQDHQARSWAASCASCHGTNGQGGYEIPALAGRSKSDLLLLLREFKADKRETATIMHQHAKGYSDAQLERIAEFFSRMAR